MTDSELVAEARRRLIEIGGRTSQDLGASRIVGQILIFLYLQQKECNLDFIAHELGLSKASVSIAARQLERLGLVKRVWVSGDRKNYYKTAENIAGALQEGVLSLVKNKVQIFGDELAMVEHILTERACNDFDDQELQFVHQRVKRASGLQRKLARLLDNPVVRFFTG